VRAFSKDVESQSTLCSFAISFSTPILAFPDGAVAENFSISYKKIYSKKATVHSNGQ
jgi:hypothetical protein